MKKENSTEMKASMAPLASAKTAEIRIGPDLSVTIVDGITATYAGHLLTLKKADPKLFAQITTEHLDECGKRYPELKPALADFVATAHLKH